MNRLKEKYNKEITPALMTKFNTNQSCKCLKSKKS
jgi:ribosomal protein L5